MTGGGGWSTCAGGIFATTGGGVRATIGGGAWNTCAGGAFVTTGGGGVWVTTGGAAWNTCAGGAFATTGGGGVRATTGGGAWNTCAGGAFAVAGGGGVPTIAGEVGGARPAAGGVVCRNVAPGALWNCGDSRVTIAGVAAPLPRLISGGVCEPVPWPAKPGSRCIVGATICPGAGARNPGVAMNGRTAPAVTGGFGCAGLCNVGRA